MIDSAKPRLVISGLALSNPHVGQGAYTARLISGLSRRLKGEFKVVLPEWVDNSSITCEAPVVRVPTILHFKHPLLQQITSGDRLVRFASREFGDAIFHSPGPIAGRRPPAATVVTIHDCIYRSFPRYLGRFFIRRLFMYATERFARDASLVLTDSAFSRDDLLERLHLQPERLEILYPWVGQEFFHSPAEDEVPALRRRLNIPERFWLYLGGFDYRKNVEFLLRCYARANEQRSLPPLVLAGSIPERRHPALCDVAGALTETGLEARQIRFTGPVATEDLPAIYRAASLLIYPSLMEGFGLPPAEAMAVGTPVLAANTSSLPEVVQKAECLFDPRKEDALIDRLLVAAEDEARFRADFPQTFTEEYGITRYLHLLGGLNRDIGASASIVENRPQ